MREHRNPYRINDPDNLLEVSANSSHPELADAKRVWLFGGYVFQTPEAVERFFNDEGLDLRHYDIEPRLRKTTGGKNEIIIRIVHKKDSRNTRGLSRIDMDGVYR